ncbi:MAG: ABC transporter permease, partial [Actinobacteria bacterium]|nr:ABC transporter permease [Actinomycetota bacterium]
MSAATVDAGAVARPRRRGIWRWIKAWPTAVKVGAVIVGLLALAALFAPLIAPYKPNEIDPFALLQSPSGRHLFGTDDTGRDVFSRTLYGLRLDIGLCLLVTFVPLPFAVIVGALAGYFGGWLDMVVSRLADIMISFPFIVLVIAVVAIVGPGVKGFLIGVPLAAWALY